MPKFSGCEEGDSRKRSQPVKNVFALVWRLQRLLLNAATASENHPGELQQVRRREVKLLVQSVVSSTSGSANEGYTKSSFSGKRFQAPTCNYSA